MAKNIIDRMLGVVKGVEGKNIAKPSEAMEALLLPGELSEQERAEIIKKLRRLGVPDELN